MVTELRVHGVNGASVAVALDRPLVRQVAGDGDAGFFRPQPEYDAQVGPGRARLEGYGWANLTTGAAARALWLLLLPFMLVNLAFWVVPAMGRRSGPVVHGALRVFALSTTATFVLSLVGVSLDLVGWQCGGSPECLRGRGYLAPLAGGFFATPGRRLALLTVVPLLGIALLWYLGRRTWARYEAFPPERTRPGEGLADPRFWDGASLVGRLRAVHLAVAFGTLDVALLGVLAGHDRNLAGYLLLGLAGLVLLAGAVAVCLPGVVDRDAPRPWADPLGAALRGTALVLLVLALGDALLPRPDWSATGGLPGYATGAIVLFGAQVVLLVLLGAVLAWVSRRGAFLGGLAAPVLGSLGLAIAAAFWTGLEFRVADFLDRGQEPAPARYVSWQAGVLQPPWAAEWVALGAVATLVVVSLVAGYTWLIVLPRLRRAAMPATDADFPGGRTTDPALAARIDGAIAGARLTDHWGSLLVRAYAPLALATAVATGFALAGVRPVRLAAAGSPGAYTLSFLVNLGAYLAGLTILALCVLVALAYRYQRIRRVVGVLWDLGTFWPRAAHPLAPPCYAERAVPELVCRAGWLATERGGLVLSGHSQGAMLAIATVLQLPAEALPATALLTYGSPVPRLYSQLFPAYVNEAVLARVGDAVADPGQPARWSNLWRFTDPVGGAAGRSARDLRLVDPRVFGVRPGDTVVARVHGHTGYEHDPTYGPVVAKLVRALPASRRRVRPAPEPPAPVRPQPAPPADAPGTEGEPAG